jgi:hypothetical protein
VLNFGNATMGARSSYAQQLAITNTGTSRVTVAALPISGSGAGSFVISGVTLPVQLSPNASVRAAVWFAPTIAGSRTASITVTATIAEHSGLVVVVTPSSVSLSGVGVRLTIGVGNSSLDYGSVLVDPSRAPTQTAMLTNTGTGNLNVSGIAISGGGGAYSATTVPPVPFTLAPNQSAEVAVQFNPTVGGPATGKVSVVSNATNSPSVILLTGGGVHWVSLSWTPSASPDVVFYNVYGGTASGGPYYRLGSLTETTYEDSESGLTAASTHYYVVTAVDNTGLESLYSNQAIAEIPTP